MENTVGGKKKRIWLRAAIIAAAVVLTLTVIPFCISGAVYSAVFARRFQTAEHLKFYVDDFEGLTEERMTFESKGRTLQGYLYSREDLDAKGVVVICHGFGGGGCNQYMDSADFFVRNGFYTFMFDATGNDLSEGSGTCGIPQYTIDLDAAISFIKQDERIGQLPVMLFGHSMGGFSACNVLNLRDDIASVAEIAGFCESTDMIAREGEQAAGKISLILMPYVKLFETLAFGENVSGDVIPALKNSDCTVMVIHSADDATVPIEYGYDKLYKEFGGDDRFTFVRYEDRGHSYADISDEAREYLKKYNDEYKAFCGEGDPSPEMKERFLKDNLDRTVWAGALDKELYGRIAEMFTAAAEKKG